VPAAEESLTHVGSTGSRLCCAVPATPSPACDVDADPPRKFVCLCLRRWHAGDIPTADVARIYRGLSTCII
jgi:hypothetical protein